MSLTFFLFLRLALIFRVLWVVLLFAGRLELGFPLGQAERKLAAGPRRWDLKRRWDLGLEYDR